MINLHDSRISFLSKLLQTVKFDHRDELRLIIAKKEIDYAFSKDFEKAWEAEYYRDLHPALKDLHNQYLEMEQLLKKEEGTK